MFWTFRKNWEAFIEFFHSVRQLLAVGKTRFQSDPESIQDLHLQLIDSAMEVSCLSENKDDPFDDIISKNYDVIDVVLRLLALPDKSYKDQVLNIFIAYKSHFIFNSNTVHMNLPEEEMLYK